ncbi:hypothetical protein Fraau_2442 [Frateuria aurantia DSM 6220]|uniref:DUF2846 domain-containing protein n=2 Tax=Frateuria aurantia TaxID=81475 RepID=H8L6C9_FRAAD|nr:hypothetical protein Fraau_2442 [Frateuria aurantia DSM 6220]
MIKQALMASAVLGLAACAQPAQHTYVHDAVSSRLFLYQPSSDGSAVLDVVRANGLFGGGCATELKIDGRVVAQFQQGERASFHLVPGSHRLEARHFGACKAGSVSLTAELDAGRHPTLAIGSHGESLGWVPAGQS